MKLKTLRIMAIITGILGTTLFNRFLEGGALFMSLILICLLLSIYFMARGVLSVKTNPVLSNKMLALINDSGILGLALGFFSAFLGLITGFDAIEASGNAEPCNFSRRDQSSSFITSFWAFYIRNFKIRDASIKITSKKLIINTINYESF